MSDDATIRFEVEGGYLALTRSIVLDPDGAATIEIGGRTSTARIDEATVDELRAQLDASNLFEDDESFEADGADLQRYTINYRGVTVVAVDGVVPEALVGPIADLEQLMLDHRR